MSARCGTEGGYYRHVRKGVPFPEDSGGPECGCRAAHREAERERAKARATKRPQPQVVKVNRRVCPECGGRKTPAAKTCRNCMSRGGRRVPHGTDSGYYYELRHGEVPCRECLDAHAAAVRKRSAGRVRPVGPRRGPQARCVDCRKAVWEAGSRCLQCAARRQSEAYLRAPEWVLRGGIWRAA